MRAGRIINHNVNDNHNNWTHNKFYYCRGASMAEDTATSQVLIFVPTNDLWGDAWHHRGVAGSAGEKHF